MISNLTLASPRAATGSTELPLNLLNGRIAAVIWVTIQSFIQESSPVPFFLTLAITAFIEDPLYQNLTTKASVPSLLMGI